MHKGYNHKNALDDMKPAPRKRLIDLNRESRDRRFFMDKNESLESVRPLLQKAVEKLKPGHSRKTGSSKQESEVGYSCWIKDLSLGKAIVECNGITYGVRWVRDKGTGDIGIQSMVPVETQYVEV